MGIANTNDEMPQAIAQLKENIAKLEGVLASSWACQTRDEYEKNLKGELKQEVLGYVTKLAIGILLFLGGAGAVFIKLSIDATYQDENKKAVANLQRRYDRQIDDARTRTEWQRYHDYGTTYRYLAELYSKAPLSDEAKRKALEHIFTRAEKYYLHALSIDPLQGSTQFELGQLYHTYAIEFNLESWHKDAEALEHYQQAVDSLTRDEVAQGWRAQALTKMGSVELDMFKAKPTSFPQRAQILDKAEGHLKQARTEYASAVQDSRKYNEPYAEETKALLGEVEKLKQYTP